MSDPQRPHGLQPSRLLHPWDFPGKSTGVGCHCLLRFTFGLMTKTTSREKIQSKLGCRDEAATVIHAGPHRAHLDESVWPAPYHKTNCTAAHFMGNPASDTVSSHPACQVHRHSFILLINKYLQSVYYMSGTMLGARGAKCKSE